MHVVPQSRINYFTFRPLPVKAIYQQTYINPNISALTEKSPLPAGSGLLDRTHPAPIDRVAAQLLYQDFAQNQSKLSSERQGCTATANRMHFYSAPMAVFLNRDVKPASGPGC
jgi:hypothetical protein